MLEEEVLDGRAIVILRGPRTACADADALKLLFHTHLVGTPAADIAACVLNDDVEDADEGTDEAERSLGSESGDVEVAAVEFLSPEGVQCIMERVQAVRARQTGAVKLIQGNLLLGAVRLLVQGATGKESQQDGGEEDPDPTQCPRTVAVPHRHEDDVSAPPLTTASAPTVSATAPLPLVKEQVAEVTGPKPRIGKKEQVFSLRVAVCDFKLLFSRREAHPHSGGGPPQTDVHRKDFPLSPFMVLQVFRSVTAVPTALRLGSRFVVNNNQTPVFRFLVEFRTEADVDRAIRDLDDVVVDLKSPCLAGSGGGASTEAALQVNVRRPHLEKYPDWLEHMDDNPRNGLTGRLRRAPHDRSFLLVGDTAEAMQAAEEKMGKPFDHAWVSPQDHPSHQPPPHGNRQHGRPPGATSGAAQVSGFARTRQAMEEDHQRQRQRYLQPMMPTRRRSRSRSSSSRSRSRSNDSGQEERHRRHDPMASVPQSTSSTVVAQPQPAMYAAVPSLYPGQVPTAMVLSPLMAAAFSHPYAVNPYMQFVQHQQQQLQCFAALQQSQVMPAQVAAGPQAAGLAVSPPISTAAVSTLSPSTATPMYGDGADAHGDLPAGWRAVFSEQYKQTYYVFHDPSTGQDTTTWTRPS